MSDLADWLLAQLAADEQVARAVNEYFEPELSAWDDPNSEFQSRGGPIFEHVLLWGPARVLADIDTRRRVIKLHETPCEVCCSGEYVAIDGVDVPRLYGMDPCTTLSLLALPYADRQGYQETWRP